MPRTAITETMKKEGVLKGVLEEYIFKYKYDDKFLADKLRITPKTFRYKRENPRKFTVKELIELSNVLQIPQDVNLFYRKEM